ncbi:MAG: AsnC family transcriptional regulator [Syntrophomonadaceae bacterium]|nr:AsnC family transcriptional regulator [Syntrophomonadaceae bacterium]MDD3024226.1 AsnC family transcriptional regulator [Syntrophomonadaceae bacterium]
MQYDDIDQEILKLVQGDLALESRPYLKLARKIRISEEEIAERIRMMQNRGLIRRFGAVLRHQKAGYTVNAMTAWKVDPEEAEPAGTIMATYSQISHCYLRDVVPEFDYNLFAMIHVKSDKELSQLLGDISRSTGIKNYTVLKSIREFKKQSMQYID